MTATCDVVFSNIVIIVTINYERKVYNLRPTDNF